MSTIVNENQQMNTEKTPERAPERTQWTPDMRNAFVEAATDSTEKHGYRGGYGFKVFPKLEKGAENEDERRQIVTEVLADVVNRAEFKTLGLGFYGLLVQKLATHPVIGHLYHRDVIVLLKGSNAHIYHVGGPNTVFKPSDVDITVCINPFLDRPTFDKVKDQVEMCVRQSLSQYKRALDHLLFLHAADGQGGHVDHGNNPLTYILYRPVLTSEGVEKFAAALQVGLHDQDDPERSLLFASPMADTNTRNQCSRNSFLLTPSRAQENHVVMVEVPHFHMCERIPLRKTPLFCSFNETIDFNRTGDTSEQARGKFNLYRLKMNMSCRSFDEERQEWKDERIPADFIDVTVPDMTDIELQYFWSRGRCMNVFDTDANQWVTIPDLDTCIAELERILGQYESCTVKKEKRVVKLQALKELRQHITCVNRAS